jgi:hypothetical protein
MPAFWLMETLCRPLQGASATIYESKALSNMRAKIGKCIVDVGGVHLMLRTFQYHALPSKSATTGSDGSSSSHLRKSLTSTGGDSDKENSGGDFGVWKGFKLMLKQNYGITEEIMANPCTALSDPMLCIGPEANLQVADIDDDLVILKVDTSRHSMDVLALLIPHVVGVDKTAPGKILQTLCDAIPILINEMGSKSGDEKVHKVYEQLLASVLKCLVSTSAVASKDTFTGTQCQKAKLVVGVTNKIMKEFPSHQGMNRDGCIVLQKVCRHLPKADRKRLGVVAALGTIVASESIDQDVKDIADEILEEQFK